MKQIHGRCVSPFFRAPNILPLFIVQFSLECISGPCKSGDVTRVVLQPAHNLTLRTNCSDHLLSLKLLARRVHSNPFVNNEIFFL